MNDHQFDVVVAADLDDGIGKGQGLPWPRLAGDLRHFKRITSTASPGRQNAIVMGRATWETLRGRPLPGRLNVVLSRRDGFAAEGASVATSLDGALEEARAADAEAVFGIGGGAVYRAAFGHAECGDVYLTRVVGRFEADTRLPPLIGFECAEVIDRGEDQGIEWRLERWSRKGGARAG